MRQRGYPAELPPARFPSNSATRKPPNLRFDKLKIDRRFVQELVTGGESEIFVRAIIGLCKGLSLTVTAKGVETETQGAAALQHGAHHGQGFLFGKAVPAAEVLRLLSAPKPAQLVD